MVGYEGEGKISIWNLKKGNTMKIHEIYSNPSGCNKVIVDRSTALNKLVIWSVHENKKLEQHMLLSDNIWFYKIIYFILCFDLFLLLID